MLIAKHTQKNTMRISVLCKVDEMKNSEIKRRSFLDATKRVFKKEIAAARRNPALAAYNAGEISWNEYLENCMSDDMWYAD